MRPLLCILGYHKWRDVGEQVKSFGIFGWCGWNAECVRCKRLAWFGGEHPGRSESVSRREETSP